MTGLHDICDASVDVTRRPAGAIPKVGVAVIGLGVGEQHARTYLRTGRCDLRWLYDLNPTRAKDLTVSLGAGQVAGSLAEILADPHVAVVSIASYDADHFQQVLAALQAGKHVFVEKPLCRTREEVQQVYAAWQQSGGPRRALVSNLVLRAAPLYRKLRQVLAEGQLGQIYAVDGEYLYGRLPKITEGWRSREAGYSVMAGGGVHLIDLILWLTGARPVRLQAVGNRICTQGTAFHYHDFVTATATLSTGAIARFTANFGCVHRHQHVLRIYGTAGTFLYDDAGARLHNRRNPAIPPTYWPEAPLPAAKGDLIPDVIEGIEQGRDWTADVQTCLDVITVCAACDEALLNQTQVVPVYP